MVSEIDNIVKGLVVSTSDFDNNKKIIGVNNDNITPDENGICPLGKQGAFIKEEKPVEQFEEISALDSIPSASAPVEETLDFSTPAPAPVADVAPVEPLPIGIPDAAPVPTEQPAAPKFILPEATVSDTTMEAPVEVAPNDSLNTLIMETPKPIEEVSKPEEVTEAEVELQMPVMDEEILASEPTGIDNSLFENAGPSVSTFDSAAPAPAPEAVPAEAPIETPALENTAAPVEAPAPAPVANPTVESAQSTNAPASVDGVDAAKVNELVGKMLDELSLKLSKHIKEDIEEYKNNLNNLLLNKEPNVANEEPKVEAAVENAPELESSVMNDAINQINNMVIPELDVPTL
jgi:hypothetical protein